LKEKIKKNKEFEEEVDDKSNEVVVLDNKGMEMINKENFDDEIISRRIEEINSMWELII
jgi:ribosomal protein S25